MTRGAVRLAGPLLLIVLVAFSARPGAAQKLARPDRYTAIAIPPTASGPPTPVDIVIERWSTDAENERVMTGLKEGGTKGMLQALLKLPQVGAFATTGSSGYPVRYAWKTTGQDGFEHVTLATDRWVSFWEASDQGRSMDYPITFIQMRLKAGGQGDGQVSVAAKVGYDQTTKLLILENFDFGPVLLKSVKHER